MTRPPMRSTARILVAGAVSGAIIVAPTPIRWAQNATPCAMLPAEAVKTPRASRSRGVRAMTFAAPRILNEPIGCRFSNFRYKFAGVSALHRTSGVRRATDAMFRRASCAWAEVMGISCILTGAGTARNRGLINDGFPASKLPCHAERSSEASEASLTAQSKHPYPQETAYTSGLGASFLARSLREKRGFPSRTDAPLAKVQKLPPITEPSPSLIYNGCPPIPP